MRRCWRVLLALSCSPVELAGSFSTLPSWELLAWGEPQGRAPREGRLEFHPSAVGCPRGGGDVHVEGQKAGRMPSSCGLLIAWGLGSIFSCR